MLNLFRLSKNIIIYLKIKYLHKSLFYKLENLFEFFFFISDKKLLGKYHTEYCGHRYPLVLSVLAKLTIWTQ